MKELLLKRVENIVAISTLFSKVIYCRCLYTRDRVDLMCKYEACSFQPGTHTPPKCPIGTFSNAVQLTDSSNCTQCTAGSYCTTVWLTDVEGNCTAGYYCPTGLWQIIPFTQSCKLRSR